MAVEVQEARPTGVNLLGLSRGEYRGLPSTLCAGCGHNSISSQIIAACYEMSVPPWKTIKLSGIGCSSKSPAYFLNRSHGFNGLHGRMPSLATGALVANRGLRGIGVSGDGDTASIGIGQFIHMLRRNIPMVYIVENNGVYGLTKGQFSATADKGQVLKKGHGEPLQPGRHLHRGPGGQLRLRRPLVRRRSASGQGTDQGRPGLQRHGGARYHQPLRHVQQPGRIHQELHLGQGARGPDPRHVGDPGARGDPRRLRAGHGNDGRNARRVTAGAAQARARLQPARSDGGARSCSSRRG